MHIAFINPQGNFDANDSYWTEHPDFGGQLVYVKEVATAMAAQGHQIDIITRQIIDREWPEFAAPLDHYAETPNVNIVRIPCGPKRFLPKEQLWPYLGAEWVPNIVNFYISTGAMPDAFSAHYGDGGLAAALLSRETGKPFTFTGHSLGAQKMDKLQASPQNLAELEARYCFSRRILAERVSMKYAGRVITSTQQERVEQYGHPVYREAVDSVEDAHFAVIPPGVNRQVFSPKRTALDLIVRDRIKAARKRDLPKGRRKLPVVLVSSRLEPKKNHIGVVKAFVNSSELRENANLGLAVRTLDDPLNEYDSLTAGEKAVMDEIVTLIEEADLWDAVTAFPLNNQAELAAAYRVLAKRRSVFALTSLYEPFGLAPLEAMSCGLPAVVTRNGGPSESMVVIGEDRVDEFGILVDPVDPYDIADGILRLLKSEDVWKKFSESGMARVVRKYTWERTADGYLRVIAELVGGPHPHSQIEIPLWFNNPSAENESNLENLSDLYFRGSI
jgi:sucrose-phosphate synthase